MSKSAKTDGQISTASVKIDGMKTANNDGQVSSVSVTIGDNPVRQTAQVKEFELLDIGESPDIKLTKTPEGWELKIQGSFILQSDAMFDLTNRTLNPKYKHCEELKDIPPEAATWFLNELGHWFWGDMSDADLLALKKQISPATLTDIRHSWADMVKHLPGRDHLLDTKDDWDHRRSKNEGPFWRLHEDD